jgi:NAD(P)-dependent dehydrogenase (short-subunit alcohol dehydrogenase family)
VIPRVTGAALLRSPDQVASIDLQAVPSIRGKRILITGGSRGIGRALTLAFLGEGARVSICSRHEEGFGLLREAGALAETVDVTDPVAVERWIVRIGQEWGTLEAVVNNAAVLHEGRSVDQPPAEWRETLEANLTGPYLVARSALKIMPRGNIVNLTSGLGFFPMEPYGAYCVSKAGLNMLTRVLALELEGAVRVNGVDPGEARTRMNPTAPADPGAVVPIVRALIALESSGPTGRCFDKRGNEVPWLGER